MRRQGRPSLCMTADDIPGRGPARGESDRVRVVTAPSRSVLGLSGAPVVAGREQISTCKVADGHIVAVMFARKTWFVLAAATAVFAVWLGFQPQAIIFGERELDGVMMQSRVECGVGVAMVFAGRFDADVPGAATRAECLRYGRTRVGELAGLAIMTFAFIYAGIRYGKEPPRPLSSELPPLPKGKPNVEGRRTRSP
jgi:hypothetical protein